MLAPSTRVTSYTLATLFTFFLVAPAFAISGVTIERIGHAPSEQEQWGFPFGAQDDPDCPHIVEFTATAEGVDPKHEDVLSWSVSGDDHAVLPPPGGSYESEVTITIRVLTLASGHFTLSATATNKHDETDNATGSTTIQIEQMILEATSYFSNDTSEPTNRARTSGDGASDNPRTLAASWYGNTESTHLYLGAASAVERMETLDW